jgi:microcystin degradation protein MlrC
MKQTTGFRSANLGLSAVLIIYATSGITAEFMSPAFHTADFFRDGPRLTVTEDNSASTAAFISIDGGILSDYAALKSRQAMEISSADSALREATNRKAQEAARSALLASPINSLMWLILALLKTQMGEPPAGPIKMSYFTGRVSSDALASRIRTIAVTSAAVDEDIRLLAQTDIQAILTRYSRFESSLIATYRQAPPDGKKFLLDTTQVVDPKFSLLLRQYP